VLKKSFWRDDQKFSGLLMRFARGDMRDHIVSHKTTTELRMSATKHAMVEPAKNHFYEIFGVVQFSTFATLSAQRVVRQSAHVSQGSREMKEGSQLMELCEMTPRVCALRFPQ
jgi:hypothetical protein